MQRVHLERDQLWGGQFYLAGDRDVPDDLAIALGLHSKPPPEDLETLPDEPEQDLPPAFTLLNSASSPVELEVLPTIGERTAKVLFDRRPEGGYLSFGHAREINSDKSHIDWGAIALWRHEE